MPHFVGKYTRVFFLLLPATLWGCNDGGAGAENGGSGGFQGVPNGGSGGDVTQGGAGGSELPVAGFGGSGGAGGSADGNGGTGGGPDTTAEALLPCEVADVLSRNCASCHGDPTVTAPMSLVTHDDFHRPGTLTQDQNVSTLVKQRIHDADDPMPPANAPQMSEEDLDVLDAWLDAGAPAGSGDDACKASAPEEENGDEEDPYSEWDNVECYELRNHGEPTKGDTTPYTVPTGEHYVEFYFDTPWTEPSVMVGWRTLYDKEEVLHHWLFYQGGGQAGGTISQGIGAHFGVELLAGWALGGNDMELPDGVAATLPSPGGNMFVEWHYFNSTGAAVEDNSGIEVCVVPKSEVDPNKIAGVTWIGSENLSLPAQQETTVRSSCTPSFNGLPEGEPVHIIGWNPHMHYLGTHMKTWVKRADGTVEKVFDKPFQFDNQLNYDQDPAIEIWPGDKIINDCVFTNTTNAAVGFGPSSEQEMCYQFTFSYPQGALSNGAPSLTGSSNTCWDGLLTDACPECN